MRQIIDAVNDVIWLLNVGGAPYVGKYRNYHRSSMQTEKSQPEGKRIMPETRFTSFPALSVDPSLGFLGLHRRPMMDYFFYLLLEKNRSF